MKYVVKIAGHPNVAGTGFFEIEGKDLVNAIKSNFKEMVSKCSYKYVPFRYPMNAEIIYNEGLLGGEGGVEVKLTWLYSMYKDRLGEEHSHSIKILADESDLKEGFSLKID